MIPFWVYAIQENSKEDQRLASRLLHSQIYTLQRKLSTSLYSEHLSQHVRGGFCWYSQVEGFLYVLHLAINIISLFEWDESPTPFPFPHLTTEQIIKMLIYLWQYCRIENTEHALFRSTQKYLCCAVLSQFSHVQLFVTLWAVACQAPQSMGFSRQENWSESHALCQGIFPTQGLNLNFLCLTISYHQVGSLPRVPPGKSLKSTYFQLYHLCCQLCSQLLWFPLYLLGWIRQTTFSWLSCHLFFSSLPNGKLTGVWKDRRKQRSSQLFSMFGNIFIY